MSLMGNHGYDESTDPGELLDAQSDAQHFAQTVDEVGELTPTDRAERLIAAARRQRAHERDLADRFGWR